MIFMDNTLSTEERKFLLKMARKAIESAVQGEKPPEINYESLSETLKKPGATFVTITKLGKLRGCIGTLEARIPLVEDTIEHAIAAAIHDFRFQPLDKNELDEIKIEISRLTIPQKIYYSDSHSLLEKLHPGLDGVIIRDGNSRATFLPQVWSKIPEKDKFMDHLCMKMGASPSLWRKGKLIIQTYQVEDFHE
jgi:AmmeMemoRadiSam system protein A